ncbi:hypothetical protein [Streptomyces lavendulocolor]|uniref:hypothetical protein n=1 Tax=Streptomyces lavendulocolor TaxID=67316 RepID=UPI003C2C06DB
MVNLKRAAEEGAGLLAMIQDLRDDATFMLTPLQFVRALIEAFGMPLPEALTLLEGLGPDLWPLVPAAEVDRRAETVLSRYVTPGV